MSQGCCTILRPLSYLPRDELSEATKSVSPLIPGTAQPLALPSLQCLSEEQDKGSPTWFLFCKLLTIDNDENFECVYFKGRMTSIDVLPLVSVD